MHRLSPLSGRDCLFQIYINHSTMSASIGRADSVSWVSPGWSSGTGLAWTLAASLSSSSAPVPVPVPLLQIQNDAHWSTGRSGGLLLAALVLPITSARTGISNTSIELEIVSLTCSNIIHLSTAALPWLALIKINNWFLRYPRLVHRVLS